MSAPPRSALDRRDDGVVEPINTSPVEWRAVAWSGGSEPGKEVNPAAVLAMQEVGIDIAAEPWIDEIVGAADVVVTMGCGAACPLVPDKRYEDWELPDPAGQDVEAVRPTRDEIERRVRTLLAALGVPAA